MIEADKVKGVWYWVSVSGEHWFPAKWDGKTWTNEDTWEDFDDEISQWVEIPAANDLLRKEAAMTLWQRFKRWMGYPVLSGHEKACMDIIARDMAAMKVTVWSRTERND